MEEHVYCTSQAGQCRACTLWTMEIAGYINVDNSTVVEGNKKSNSRAIVSSSFLSRRTAEYCTVITPQATSLEPNGASHSSSWKRAEGTDTRSYYAIN
jgi:hypothetical protein